MGIPFLMFMGPCLFIDQVQLFVIPFRYFYHLSRSQDLLLFVYLLMCWVIFRSRNIKYSEKNIGNKTTGSFFNTADYLIVSLIVITIIGFGVVLKDYYILNDTYNRFIILISLFTGFFVFKDIVNRTETEVLNKFLFSIVILNSIAAVLYFVHQGLHISIYTTSKEYLAEIVDGETITRTFWFMPNLLFFSISYLLVIKKSKSLINIILLVVNIMAVYISYTRTSLIIIVLILLVFYLLTGYKSMNFKKSIRGLILIAAAGITMFFTVSSFLPTSTKYFISRFKDLEKSPVDAHSNNLVYRFYKTGLVINKMDPVKTLFGYGPVTETQMLFMKYVKKATDDMAWAEIVFRWGFLGLIVFFLLYIVSIIKAFFLFMKTDGLISKLALLFLLVIFAQLVDSFTQSTIMYPNRFPLSLWHFGILSALLSIYKRNESIQPIELAEDNY